MLTDGREWCGLLWWFSQLSFWRHPFTGEQLMECYTSPNLIKKHIYTLDGPRGSTVFSKLSFAVGYRRSQFIPKRTHPSYGVQWVIIWPAVHKINKYKTVQSLISQPLSLTHSLAQNRSVRSTVYSQNIQVTKRVCEHSWEGPRFSFTFSALEEIIRILCKGLKWSSNWKALSN